MIFLWVVSAYPKNYFIIVSLTRFCSHQHLAATSLITEILVWSEPDYLDLFVFPLKIFVEEALALRVISFDFSFASDIAPILVEDWYENYFCISAHCKQCFVVQT